MQIGLKDFNIQNHTSIDFNKKNVFGKFLKFLQTVVGHQFHEKVFVSSEERQNYAQYECFYKRLMEQGVMVDIREFKQGKTLVCKGCKTPHRQKVQAEVDVSIAVKMIAYAQRQEVRSITLFAGDRDFIDAINFVSREQKKELIVMGYRENLNKRIINDTKAKIIMISDLLHHFIKFESQHPLQLIQPQRPANDFNQIGIRNKLDKKQPLSLVDNSKQQQWQVKNDPLKDPVVLKILSINIPKEQEIMKGEFFKEEKFPKETIEALQNLKDVGEFEAEHAIFVTGSTDLTVLLKFILNTHEFLAEKLSQFSLLIDYSILEYLYISNYLSISMFLLVTCFICRMYQTKKTKFYFQPTLQWKDLFEKTQLLQMVYRPWTFAATGFGQSMLFAFVELGSQIIFRFKTERELFELSDGGHIALDWFVHKDSKKSEKDEKQRPLVAIIPGITGDASKLYMISLAKASYQHGYDVCVVNYRGLGGVPLKTPKTYHGACTDDFKEAFDYLYEDYCDSGKKRKLFSIGISLGAGILANYVAKEGNKCPLTACCAVGCHFDTFKAMEFLKSNLYGFYDYSMGYFVKTASRDWIKQYDELVGKKCPNKVVSQELEKVKTLSDDFSKVIAKLAGFKGIKEYYQECTVTHRLKDIKVPTFFLSSLDDPFYGPQVIPQEINNENILIAVTKTGGHLCHFQGLFLPTQWFPEPCFEFLNYFQNSDNENQPQSSKLFTKNDKVKGTLTISVEANGSTQKVHSI